MRLSSSTVFFPIALAAIFAAGCDVSEATIATHCPECGPGMTCGLNGQCQPASPEGTTGTTQTSTANLDSLPCEASQVLDTYCSSCHGPTPQNGAPYSIQTRSDLLANSPTSPGQTIAQRSVARMRAAQQPMPPLGSPRPSSQEIAGFEGWVNAGGPAGTCTRGATGSTSQTGGQSGSGGQTGSGTGTGTGTGSGTGTGTGTGSGTGTSSAAYCKACSADADCGGGNNYCLGFSFGDYCGTDCSSGQSCPSGSVCQTIYDGANNPIGKDCVPASGQTCPGAGGGGTSSDYCKACSADADCGGGNNYCLGFSFGDYCGTDCGSGQSCPSGSVCQTIVDGSNNPIGKNCVPSSGSTCSSGSGGTGGGTTGGGTGSGGGTCTSDTWAGGWPSSFFSTHCSSCHGSEFSTVSNVRSNRNTIASYISSGSMPQNETLSSSTKDRIVTWLQCGAP